MEWEVWVCAAEDGDEMIFEGLDGPFGGITAVDVQGGASWKSTSWSMRNLRRWVEALLSRCWR